jgi:hypothetical protein
MTHSSLAVHRAALFLGNLDTALLLLTAGSEVRTLLKRRPELILKLPTKHSSIGTGTLTGVLPFSLNTVGQLLGWVRF